MDFQKEWQKFIQELPSLSTIHTPRYITRGLSIETPQLHIFWNSSGWPYGAAAYLRMPVGMDAFYAE